MDSLLDEEISWHCFWDTHHIFQSLTLLWDHNNLSNLFCTCLLLGGFVWLLLNSRCKDMSKTGMKDRNDFFFFNILFLYLSPSNIHLFCINILLTIGSKINFISSYQLFLICRVSLHYFISYFSFPDMFLLDWKCIYWVGRIYWYS